MHWTIPPPADLPDHLALSRCRYGTMLYPLRDEFVGRALAAYGEYSQAETDILAQIVPEGGTVVEVGANIGALTLPLARMVGLGGTVLAFEPQRVLFQILCANMALNGISQVDARPLAVGAAPGTAQVPRCDLTQPYNFGSIELDDEGGDTVPLVTVDSLDLAQLHLLKVDSEGMESDVLDGAQRTIARLRPLLFLENDRIAQSPDLIRRVFDLDYRAAWVITALTSANSFSGSSEDLFPGIAAINMLCVPREVELNAELHEVASPSQDWRDVIGVPVPRADN